MKITLPVSLLPCDGRKDRPEGNKRQTRRGYVEALYLRRAASRRRSEAVQGQQWEAER